MTREEAIKVLNMVDAHGLADEAKHMAIKALEREPCEDAISREAVHDLLATWLSDYLTDETREALETIDEKVADLPSVNPQPKTGHWIYDRTRDWDGECKYECSECGMGSDVDYPYCMRCGAKMESEDKI